MLPSRIFKCFNRSASFLNITRRNFRSYHKTHYELLDVPMNASVKEIKESYDRMKANLITQTVVDSEDLEENQQLQRAYEVLTNYELRKLYDIEVHGLKFQDRLLRRYTKPINVTEIPLDQEEMPENSSAIPFKLDEKRLNFQDIYCQNSPYKPRPLPRSLLKANITPVQQHYSEMHKVAFLFMFTLFLMIGPDLLSLIIYIRNGNDPTDPYVNM